MIVKKIIRYNQILGKQKSGGQENPNEISTNLCHRL